MGWGGGGGLGWGLVVSDMEWGKGHHSSASTSRHYLLPTTYYLLLTTYHFLLTTYCLLLTNYY